MKGELLFLVPSQVLLGAIMAVMKPHLSPSQHNLIIHNGAAAVWNEDDCALFKGQSYMCVQQKRWMFDCMKKVE